MTSDPSSSDRGASQVSGYWPSSLKITLSILAIWAAISLGCGILFREFLDKTVPSVGGAPFGFWMAQQGSILGFVLLLVGYMVAMNRLDHVHGYDESTNGEESV
ncbi:MAG: DUF4212 domain-containing protein [Planctomycetota bacterium]